jgi:hypothetical protein
MENEDYYIDEKPVINYWDGSYCMICQDNYGDANNTCVENFLCTYCMTSIRNGNIKQRMTLLEESASRSLKLMAKNVLFLMENGEEELTNE